MLLLLCFSFLAGVFTALSPCVLPVLPAILAAGVSQGRLRPLGTILGLVCSFSFFTLTLSWVVHATGISPNILRYIAIVLVFFFGLVMLFPGLSNWFAKVTSSIAAVGQKIQGKKARPGFWGGIVFGVALGLLWTPCAGPILAAVMTLVASGQISLAAVLATLFYSIGAGIPLFLLAYGSAKLVKASHFLSRYSERIRQFFGVLMIFFALVLALNWDTLINQKISQYLPEMFSEKDLPVAKELAKIDKQSDLPDNGPAPELTGIVGWINTSPLTLSEFKGKIVLVDFWSYSCAHCLKSIPYVKNWYSEYKSEGLVIISVHTPEFAFERDYDNVKKAVESLGIKYPVALDNHYFTWNAYHVQYRPAFYLVDREGNIRMKHFGEGGYAETEDAIRSLLGLAKKENKGE